MHVRVGSKSLPNFRNGALSIRKTTDPVLLTNRDVAATVIVLKQTSAGPAGHAG